MMRDVVTISAQVEAELRDRLRELAEENERSFSAELRLALKAYLEREQK